MDKLVSKLRKTSQNRMTTTKPIISFFVDGAKEEVIHTQKKRGLKFKSTRETVLTRRGNTEKICNNNNDVTPKSLIPSALSYMNMDDDDDQELFWDEELDLNEQFLGIHSDKDEITDRNVGLDLDDMDDEIRNFSLYPVEELAIEPKAEDKIEMPRFIKITLTETENVCLFEQSSFTVIKGTEEAKHVIEDNERYEYLTEGKGKIRRRAEAETQTIDILFKSRSTNTERINKFEVETFVSNYDMYDTYTDLDRVTKNVDLEDNKQIEITTYTGGEVDKIHNMLKENENFRLSAMIIERLLAGNVFETSQKRYRNMYRPDPLDTNAKYLYRMECLWTYKMNETLGKAVSCLSWCETNTDIIAIGYGIYNFVTQEQRRDGYVCVWSMKNPVNPERRYQYPVPVTAVCFSQKNPQLLAVGLYNGTVEVLDITSEIKKSIGKSHRSSSPGFEPIWGIRWIQGEDAFGIDEQILTISQDGRIMKYNFITGPYILGYQQLWLNRVEGVVEGIQVVKQKEFIEANRHPQALTLTIHPSKLDDYFVGTDEGCLHRSSINFPHQHKVQVHNGGVYGIEFSPWSPKVFLTCGSDFYIRIWVDGIFEPICELTSGFESVNNVYWSPINPTIFASATRSKVEMWDLKRKTLKPASVHSIVEGVSLTVIQFTRDGRSIMVGDEEGKTHFCALEDMPFPPHFPYSDLESTLYKLLELNPQILKQVKSLGYLGY